MFKTLWQLMDGKKLISGLGLVGVGFGLKHIPGLQDMGNDIMFIGMSIAGIGGGHKVRKHIKKKKEK